MNCMLNLKRITYPKDLVYDLTRLYTYRGKDFYYANKLKQNKKNITKSVIEKDTVYAAKILNLDVSDNRLKLIVKNDSEPKNNNEKIVRNLKNVFTILQERCDDPNYLNEKYLPNDLLAMANKVFKDVIKSVKYKTTKVKVTDTLIVEEKTVTARDAMDELAKLYVDSINTYHYETVQTIVSFYVDVINMDMFDHHNDFIALIIVQTLLLNRQFYVFKYKSFFEELYKNIRELKAALDLASFDWKRGYPKTENLNQIVLRIIINCYEEVDFMARNVEFDKTLTKFDNVKAAILKLGEVFSKEDIKKVCPNESESTINRALKCLKDEKKIEPDGTGRTAKWIRLTNDELFSTDQKQIDIFSYIKG